jgi:predicted lipoprotein with Yx(FWY)xxD motif
MKGNVRTRAGVIALLAALFTLAGAGADSTHAATSTRSAVGAIQAATPTAHSSRYGTILFGGGGRVLYAFARDRGGRSNCSGACAKAWPPFLTNGTPKPGRGINGRLLGTTRRSDGTLQVTYAKHPLYYFKKDTKPGQITCQNVSNFGGLWLVVASTGRPVR